MAGGILRPHRSLITVAGAVFAAPRRAAEERLSGLGVPVLSEEDIQLLAMLVDHAVQDASPPPSS